MATKRMFIHYQGQINTENPDGSFTTTGNLPDYASLMPLILDGVLLMDGGGAMLDATGMFYYNIPLYEADFLYDDSNEAAILACFSPCGFARYHSVDVSYYGIVGTEPSRQYNN